MADYLIVPEMHAGVLGVTPWNATACTVTGRTLPQNGAFSVADPRYDGAEFGQWGVRKWTEATGAVTSQRAPGQGPVSVADPRISEHARTVTGTEHCAGGAPAVADPRYGASAMGEHTNKMRVVDWEHAAPTVTGSDRVGSGALSVADPRYAEGPRGPHFNNVHRVVDWTESSPTVSGGNAPSAGGLSVADPRPAWTDRYNNLAVTPWTRPSNTVIAGGKGVQGGWMSVADPRVGIERGRGDNYATAGHYGVVPWNRNSGAVAGAACHDNGPWNVADPRIGQLPSANTKMVVVIQALDGTWHRPFTTLELAALQSLVDPEEMFDLDGNSDSAKRERIGNAVPPRAAQAIADMMGETLLLAMTGEQFMLSSLPVWVRPVAVALSVDTLART